MRLLFIDLETSGLPIQPCYDRYYPYSQLQYYTNSRIVQISITTAILELDEFTTEENVTYTIKPDGFEIKNSHIHGITQEIANLTGVPFTEAITSLSDIICKCDMIVAHNLIFDKNVLLSELYRYKFNDIINRINIIEEFCTSRGTTNITKLPFNKVKYKQPKLIELYKHLFGTNPIGQMHEAQYDVKIMIECFRELLKKKLIEI
jgi:DNA polymerase III epsilon subunit-like protein